LPLELVKDVGLKYHPRIVGFSRLSNGKLKWDYLVELYLSIFGVKVPVVVKIARNQPSLLGVDVMWQLELDLHLSSLECSISPMPRQQSPFPFINLHAHMTKLGLTHNDLLPLTEEVPDPDEAIKTIDGGDSTCALDLGTSNLIALPHLSCLTFALNLGTSYANYE
jgi:hypothetical protein